MLQIAQVFALQQMRDFAKFHWYNVSKLIYDGWGGGGGRGVEGAGVFMWCGVWGYKDWG